MEVADQLKELGDDLRSTHEEFKKLLDEGATEREKLGEESAETKAAIERANTRLDDIEVRLGKIKLDDGKAADEVEGRKEFLLWCMKGEQHQDGIEAKAFLDEIKAQLQIGDDTAGGVLAPPDYVQELLKGVIEFSPLRELARVTTTTRTSVKVPKRTGTFAATWTASAGTRTETTGLTYGLEEIPTHELYARAEAEQQLLEDSLFNLEDELGMEFSEQFGVAEATAFVSGDAVGKPEGFLTNSDVAVQDTATDNVLAADDVITLYYLLKDAYARNATWLMNRQIIKAVRQLKGSDNNYLWQPGLAGDQPPTILGRPYREATDMASSVADAAKIIALGDWRRGYRIVDRIALMTQRDPYTSADAGAIVFRARKRVGGQVVIPEAIKILRVQ